MKRIILIILVPSIVFFAGFWIGGIKLADNAGISGADPKEVEKLVPTYSVSGGEREDRDYYRYLTAAKWYGFRYRIQGSGCTDPTNNDNNHAQNKRTNTIMTKRFGKNWLEKFEVTVDSLYSIDSLAVHIVKNDINVREKIKTWSAKYNRAIFPIYNCYFTPESYSRVISVEWQDKINNDSSNVSFMRVLVDLRADRVINIENNAMEWKQYR